MVQQLQRRSLHKAGPSIEGMSLGSRPVPEGMRVVASCVCSIACYPIQESPGIGNLHLLRCGNRSANRPHATPRLQHQQESIRMNHDVAQYMMCVRKSETPCTRVIQP
jgi:hypothetical protein